MLPKKRKHIVLLFNANKVYDRDILKGIGQYFQKNNCAWDLYLDEEFVSHPEQMNTFNGDGVIADLDDPSIVEAMLSLKHNSTFNIPIIGVGSSYQNSETYPPFPYIATDNEAIIDMAYQHLRDKGLSHFAFYGLEQSKTQPTLSIPFVHKKWAAEREAIFRKIMLRQQHDYAIFHGHRIHPNTWQTDLSKLSQWLLELPQPTGIIAVTDARARILLQACENLGLSVPHQFAIIGIDNEELTQYLSRTPLSSIQQNGPLIGYRAAQLLDHHLHTALPLTIPQPQLIPPIGIIPRYSSAYQALLNPDVISAVNYIRQHALHGIKVQQVIDATNLSRSNLEAKFKAELGYSMHSLLHTLKREHAEMLIRTTHLSFNDCAKQSGYHSVQYLYAVFLKHYQLTPKQYRKIHGNL